MLTLCDVQAECLFKKIPVWDRGWSLSSCTCIYRLPSRQAFIYRGAGGKLPPFRGGYRILLRGELNCMSNNHSYMQFYKYIYTHLKYTILRGVGRIFEMGGNKYSNARVAREKILLRPLIAHVCVTEESCAARTLPFQR